MDGLNIPKFRKSDIKEQMKQFMLLNDEQKRKETRYLQFIPETL